MQIQVPKQSSKWVEYVVDAAPTSDPTNVRESSIPYRVVATGKIKNEKVTFMISYALRNAKATDKKKDLQLGHFDVYNGNNNAKRAMSKRWTNVLVGSIVVFAFLFSNIIEGAIGSYVKRGIIKEYSVVGTNRDLIPDLAGQQVTAGRVSEENVSGENIKNSALCTDEEVDSENQWQTDAAVIEATDILQPLVFAHLCQ